MKSDEFIREVDEELQQEKLAELWKRYGNLVLAVLVVFVGGTAAWVGWQHWTVRQNEAEAARFIAAASIMEPPPPAEAARALQSFAADASPGFRALALLKAAAANATAEERAAAVTDLEKVALDPKADPLLRDAARIMALGQQLDSIDAGKAVDELKPLAVAGAPWRHYARQLLAAAYLKGGNKAEAKVVLEQIIGDGEAPPTAQRRAKELLDSLDESRGAPS